MRIRGTPKAFVESDVGRDTWLRTRESEFCYRRARCLATRDIQTTRTEDFWRVAHSQELIRAFRGYAAQPVDSTLPPWDQEKMRVFQTVDYLDRHRQSFSATTTVAYAALTAAVLLGLPTIISHPHEAIRVSTCHLRRTKNTRTHVVAVKPRTVAFAGFRVTSIELLSISLVFTEQSMALSRQILRSPIFSRRRTRLSPSSTQCRPFTGVSGCGRCWLSWMVAENRLANR